MGSRCGDADAPARHEAGVLIPLQREQIDQALTAVKDRFARLAGVHAARPQAITATRLDDADLGNRRLNIAGQVRPLDDLTYDVLVESGAERHTAHSHPDRHQ